MKRKIIAAALTAAMLAPVSALAEEWIELSAWSYNEVSGFVSDGLMPDMLKGKGDYKQSVTRGEFAELIYNVLDKTGMLVRNVNLEPFSDCGGYIGAQMLGSLGIAEGVTDTGFDRKAEFAPENNITREDAAVLLSRAVKLSFNSGSMYSNYDFSKIQERYDDIDGLSDYAINPVRYMFQYNIMAGDDANRRFDPKGSLTIEQAVLMAYRYYKALPRVIEADNEGAADGEVLRTFGGGIAELYKNNTYYINDSDGAELMSFETDVYSSLLCCEFSGERLCFAVNFNDRTDVYNLDTRELKYTIPDIVYELDGDKGYAYTYSGRFMPVYSGMWSMNGYLEIPPCYSRSEVDELIASAEANGAEVYAEPTDAPDAEPQGMLYYSDAENGGRLCRIDSNGRNKRVLADDDCRRTVYINGALYFAADGDGIQQIYCIDPDGGEKYRICEAGEAAFCAPKPAAFRDDCDEEYLNQYRDINRDGDIMGFFGDTANYSALNGGALMYGKISDTSDMMRLYEVRLTESGAEKIQISDFSVYYDQVIAPYDGSGRIFFTEYAKMYNNGSSPLYMYDGTGTKCISGGYNVISCGFKKGADGRIKKDRIYFTAEELGAGKCAYIDLNTGEITVYTPTGEEEYSDSFISRYTEDNYFISYNKNGLEVDTWETQTYNMRVKYNGETTEIPRARFKKVIGDYIYYIESAQMIYATDSVYRSYIVRQIGNTPLYAYNYKTGRSMIVADDYYSDSIGSTAQYINGFGIHFGGRISNEENADSDIFIYYSASGAYKQVKGDKAVTVYPNKGIHKCGRVYAVGEIAESTWTDGCLYKVDEDGNISYLTDGRAEYWMYVPNGSKAPQFAYSTYTEWSW